MPLGLLARPHRSSTRTFARSDRGNIGATNVWRTYGRGLGIPVVFLDTLKGFVPAFVAMQFVSPPHLCGIAAGGAAMLGHWRPLFLGFAKGGKMVATCGGVFFGVAPWVALIGRHRVARRLLRRSATRRSPRSSPESTLPVAAVVFGYPVSVIVFGVAAFAAILFLHRGNLRRLRAGTESRFNFGRPRHA